MIDENDMLKIYEEDETHVEIRHDNSSHIVPINQGLTKKEEDSIEVQMDDPADERPIEWMPEEDRGLPLF